MKTQLFNGRPGKNPGSKKIIKKKSPPGIFKVTDPYKNNGLFQQTMTILWLTWKLQGIDLELQSNHLPFMVKLQVGDSKSLHEKNGCFTKHPLEIGCLDPPGYTYIYIYI